MVAIIVFSGRESNTISACRCALKIQENFANHGIEDKIGIATGKVFFGPVGDERRCEMAWIGDSVNLAARLMGRASVGAVFVDKATCENASSELSFEMHGMVELKGKGVVTVYELQGLKHRGSVLMESRRRSSVHASMMLSRPMVFDNAAAVISSIAVEAGLTNARKKEPLTNRTTASREAVCFCISISRQWTSTAEEYVPFCSMLRESIVDFGGEISNCSPFETAELSPPNAPLTPTDRGVLLVEGFFLTGELPIRQSGSSKTSMDISDAVLHFISFLHYMLFDDSFCELSRVLVDTCPSNTITGIGVDTGIVTLDIASNQGAASLAASPAIDVAKALVSGMTESGMPMSYMRPPTLVTPQFLEVLEHLELFEDADPESLSSHPYKPVCPPTCPTPASLTTAYSISHIITDDLDVANPGIGMPLSFVRRFHNENELDYANAWMKHGCSALLQAAIDGGARADRATGCLTDACLLVLIFSAPSGSQSPKATLASYRKVIMAVLGHVEKDGGGVFSACVVGEELHLSLYLPVPIVVASFTVTKIGTMFHRTKDRGGRDGKTTCYGVLKYAIIDYGDLMWRVGFSGGTVPYGPVIDNVTTQLNLIKKTWPPTETVIFVNEKHITRDSRSRLINFSHISEPVFSKWKSPSDVLTNAVTAVFERSEMAGRTKTRKVLAQRLERLLLVSESSITILEARAGFGKSITAGEIIKVAQELKLPYMVVRTSIEDEGSFGIWTSFCAELLRIIPRDKIGEGTGDLVYHLPGDCGIQELHWLNDLLPAAWRVQDRELENSDDPYAFAAGVDGRAPNSNLKLNLFASLIKSLVEMAGQFILLVEDLQVRDCG